MAKSHQAIGLRYPAFDIWWIAKKVDKNEEAQKENSISIAIAGGGGSAKSGIGNLLNICELKWRKKKLELETPIELDTGEELCGIITVHPRGSIICCGFGPLFRVYAAFDDRLVFIGEQVSDLAEEGPSVNSICFNPTGDKIIAGGEDGVVRIWKLKNLEEAIDAARKLVSTDKETCGKMESLGHLSISAAKICKGHTGPITSVAYHPIFNIVCSTAKDSSCRLFNVRTGSELAQLPCKPDPKAEALEQRLAQRGRRPRPPGKPQYRTCCFSPLGDSFFTIQSSSRGPVTLKRWEIGEQTGSAKNFAFSPVEAKTARPANVPATCLAVSPDGERVAVGTVEGKAVILDALSLKLVRQHQAHELPITADKTFTVMKSRGGYADVIKRLLLILAAILLLLWGYSKCTNSQYVVKPKFLHNEDEYHSMTKEKPNPEISDEVREAIAKDILEDGKMDDIFDECNQDPQHVKDDLNPSDFEEIDVNVRGSFVEEDEIMVDMAAANSRDEAFGDATTRPNINTDEQDEYDNLLRGHTDEVESAVKVQEEEL